METIMINGKKFFIVIISDKYEEIKSFDLKKKFKNKKLADNQCFIIVSRDEEMHGIEIRIIEVNVLSK